jgi:hypothetical protein
MQYRADTATNAHAFAYALTLCVSLTTISMEKVILIFLVLLVPSFLFCQTGKVTGHLNNTDTIHRSIGGSKVFLKLKDSIIRESVISNSGYFTINDVSPGIYSLTIVTIGFRNETKDSVKVSDNVTTAIELDFPFPCKYIYKNDEKPKCISNHTDNIIPIIYGLPTGKTLKSAKKGLVFLGGCIVSDCDPRFYCKTHKLEL